MTDIRALDLNLLKALDALLDERNVTRAAQRLGLTQPAVSGSLTRLREVFDDPLFVRTQRGVIPTPRALEMAESVKRLLSDAEALLLPPVFDPATVRMTLSIAATDYALRAIVVPFLSVLRSRAPNIRVSVRPIVIERMQAQFENADIDLALVTPETIPQDLRARRLFDEDYVCALRHGHPDAATGELPLDRFCALDHALVSFDGGHFRGVTDEALARIGRERRVLLSVASFLVLPEILRMSDLVAVVPSRLVVGVDGVSVISPPLEIPGFTKMAAWHERSHRDPGHRWIRSVLFEVCDALV
ncbi:LysR family transcriptional regulator [Rhizobium sp. NPDC090279]|uniref:LysR family transcriptional regulator n=1 Tax=Rhizobium sp. NPDC090279 TaxID=3364499 RepID=UPI00383B12A1